MAEVEPLNTNYLSPNKFKLAIARFPNVNFFAQRAPLPGFTTGSVHIATSAPTDYYEIGDKMVFNDFMVEFIIDEDMNTLKEILSWSQDAMVKNRKDFNPFSEIAVLVLNNNSNANLLFKIHNAFPYMVPDVDMSAKLSEDKPITMEVFFKYSHYTIGE